MEYPMMITTRDNWQRRDAFTYRSEDEMIASVRAWSENDCTNADWERFETPQEFCDTFGVEDAGDLEDDAWERDILAMEFPVVRWKYGHGEAEWATAAKAPTEAAWALHMHKPELGDATVLESKDEWEAYREGTTPRDCEWDAAQALDWEPEFYHVEVTFHSMIGSFHVPARRLEEFIGAFEEIEGARVEEYEPA